MIVITQPYQVRLPRQQTCLHTYTLWR